MKYDEQKRKWATRRATIQQYARGKSLSEVAQYFRISRSRAQQIVGKRNGKTPAA